MGRWEFFFVVAKPGTKKFGDIEKNFAAQN